MTPIRRGTVVLALILLPLPAVAEPLFPRPLHLVRVLEDPLAGTAVTIDEYYEGNRVVAVSGSLVAIADYAGETLTRIDRAKARYSVTRFADLAAAREALIPSGGAIDTRVSDMATTRSLGTHLDRTVELHVAHLPEAAGSIEVAVDRSFALSARAVEVITGSAWPGVPTPHGRIALLATAPSAEIRGIRAESTPVHGLPVRTRVTLRVGSESLTIDDRITAVDEMRISAETIAIPVGAAEVLHPDLEAAREMRELDATATLSDRR